MIIIYSTRGNDERLQGLNLLLKIPAKAYLQKLTTICARNLKKFRQPYPKGIK
jgi:hypothetical protein